MIGKLTIRPTKAGEEPREIIRVTASGFTIFWTDDAPAGTMILTEGGDVVAGRGTALDDIYRFVEKGQQH